MSGEGREGKTGPYEPLTTYAIPHIITQFYNLIRTIGYHEGSCTRGGDGTVIM